MALVTAQAILCMCRGDSFECAPEVCRVNPPSPLCYIVMHQIATTLQKAYCPKGDFHREFHEACLRSVFTFSFHP